MFTSCVSMLGQQEKKPSSDPFDFSYSNFTIFLFVVSFFDLRWTPNFKQTQHLLYHNVLTLVVWLNSFNLKFTFVKQKRDEQKKMTKKLLTSIANIFMHKTDIPIVSSEIIADVIIANMIIQSMLKTFVLAVILLISSLISEMTQKNDAPEPRCRRSTGCAVRNNYYYWIRIDRYRVYCYWMQPYSKGIGCYGTYEFLELNVTEELWIGSIRFLWCKWKCVRCENGNHRLYMVHGMWVCYWNKFVKISVNFDETWSI